MIRFAVIGTNDKAGRFLRAISGQNELIPYAVYAKKIEEGRAFAENYHIPTVYDNIEELAEDEGIDAVYIASLPSEHFGQTVMMLNYGKHVLCENPAVSNLRELELILDAAYENQVIYMEAVPHIYLPGFSWIREHLLEIGPVTKVRIFNCHYSAEYDDWKKGRIGHTFYPKFSNGALMNAGSCAIQFLVNLFGKPKLIRADAILLPEGCDGSGRIIADYESMQAEIIYSEMENEKKPSQIRGEKGWIQISDILHLTRMEWIDHDGNRKSYHVRKIRMGEQDSDLIYTIQEFERRIREQKTDHQYYQNMIKTFEIMDEARRQIGLIFPADKIMEV